MASDAGSTGILLQVLHLELISCLLLLYTDWEVLQANTPAGLLACWGYVVKITLGFLLLFPPMCVLVIIDGVSVRVVVLTVCVIFRGNKL